MHYAITDNVLPAHLDLVAGCPRPLCSDVAVTGTWPRLPKGCRARRQERMGGHVVRPSSVQARFTMMRANRALVGQTRYWYPFVSRDSESTIDSGFESGGRVFSLLA